jgi:tripartite-type tricarboxylate transporter receptor subunit TctC
MTPTISSAVAWIAAASLALAAGASLAQDFPSKPIRIVVPYPAGTQIDLPVRIIADAIQARFGQPMVTDYRPGAGGLVGHDYVAKQPADGYTLIFSGSPLPLYPVFSKQTNFDPVKSFSPVSMVGSIVVVLFAATADKFPPRNLAEAVAYIKANPGKLNFGDVGSGPPLMVWKHLERSYALTATTVSYKGSNEAITELLRGDIQMAFLGLAGRQGLAKEGKVRMFAVLGKRSMVIPEVPPLQETGLANIGTLPYVWYGIVGPAGMPRSVVDRLNGVIGKVVLSSEFTEKNLPNGIEPNEMTTEQFAQQIAFETKFWADLAKQVGVSPQ